MDSSTELIQSLLPVFVVVGLGASPAMLGLIEGIAEATAAVLKGVSGVWSDRMGRRLPLALSGYAVAAAAKLLFPLATSVGWVLGARAIDRIGKGLRGAPRDALVTELTPVAVRGAAFGMRQALDTVGAVLGPLLAAILMVLLHGDFRTVFWFACIPAGLAVAVLWLGVDESGARVAGARPPGRSSARSSARRPEPAARRPHRAAAVPGALGGRLWALIGIGAVFGLARFSEAFLLLDAGRLGLSSARVPLVLLVMNLTYAVSAYPSGAASDRVGRLRLLGLGVALLVAADATLWAASTPAGVLVGAALWGLHLGLTQGAFSALVSDCSAADSRGAAFGAYHMTTGAAALASNLVAGQLWQSVGSAMVFTVSGGLAVAAGVGLLWWGRGTRSRSSPAVG